MVPPSFLPALLRQQRAAFAPDYAGGLTNHLPMCLIALAAFGADEARCAAFARTYATQLEPRRGRDDVRVCALRAELRARGRDAVLRDQLGAVLLGCAGAAWHGVLRVAYALSIDDDELADALGYALDRTVEFALAPRAPTTVEPLDVLAQIRARDLPVPKGSTITERMRAISAAHPEVLHDAAGLALEPGRALDSLDAIARAALALYTARPAFVTLHALTGTEAVRAALTAARRVDVSIDEAVVVRRHLAAVTLAYVVAGCPEPGSGPAGSAPPTWDELGPRIVASGDDHLAKLALACRIADARSPAPLWRTAVAQALAQGAA